MISGSEESHTLATWLEAQVGNKYSIQPVKKLTIMLSIIGTIKSDRLTWRRRQMLQYGGLK